MCWFSMHVFLCLATLHDVTFKTCHIVKIPLSKSTGGETPVKSIHAWLTPTHLKTKTSVGISVECLSNGSIGKFTRVYFLADAPAYLNMLKRTYLTRSCRYLKPFLYKHYCYFFVYFQFCLWESLVYQFRDQKTFDELLWSILQTLPFKFLIFKTFYIFIIKLINFDHFDT